MMKIIMTKTKAAFRGIALSLFLCAVAIQASGCFALFVGAAAASGVVWVKGKLQQNLDAPLERVHSATLSALKKLSLPVIADRIDKSRSKVESEYSDGKHVWIQMDYLTKSATRIIIRAGTLGDETRSREILDNIIRQL